MLLLLLLVILLLSIVDGTSGYVSLRPCLGHQNVFTSQVTLGPQAMGPQAIDDVTLLADQDV